MITMGSSPGDVIVPLSGPMLPAEVTTTMPALQACSTAWSSGSRADGEGGSTPREMLSTWIPSTASLSIAHCTPSMTVPSEVTPLLPATLMDTRSASGATPVYWPPEERPLEPISPATKVP